MLTVNQKQTLAAALRAETNAGVVAAMAIRNDVFLSEWCNAPSTTLAWNESVDRATLFDATDITKFDGISQGKRDAWKLMMDNTPIDAGRNKIRKAVQDIWGNADSVAVLQDFRRPATNAEVYLGGSDATTNTVTARKLKWTGQIGLFDMSDALNRF